MFPHISELSCFKLRDFMLQLLIYVLKKLILMLHDAYQIMHGIEVLQLNQNEIFKVEPGVSVHILIFKYSKNTLIDYFYALKAQQR